MEFTEAQKTAIESNSDRILVVAGPGSGKTSVLVSRICRLIQEGQDQKGIVAITFTNAAAIEMKTRIGNQLGEDFRLGYIGTLHSYILRILSGKGLKFAVLQEDDRDEVLRESIDLVAKDANMTKLKASLAKGPFGLPRIPIKKEDKVAAHFFATMMRQSVVDYDMILHLGREHAGEMRGTHLFVDEYQDSGPVDAAIYTNANFEKKFFVGDPDQSIYKFRGARPENMDELAEEDGVELIKLQENFRSGSSICFVANNLISHDRDRVIRKETISRTGEKGQLVLLEGATALHEVEAIAQDMNAGGENWEEIAVLCRTNALVKETRIALQARGIPVKTWSSSKPRGWKDALSLLQVIADPSNDAIAYWTIRRLKGKAYADEGKRQALKTGRPIWETFIATKFVQRDQIMDIFGRIKEISVEATRWIQSILDENEEKDIREIVVAAMGDDEEDLSPGVEVCTIHKSKGREWDDVYLPAVEEGLIPNLSKSSSMSEERRLLFVAITRARRRLVVSVAKERATAYSPLKETTKSRFIVQLRRCEQVGE